MPWSRLRSRFFPYSSGYHKTHLGLAFQEFHFKFMERRNGYNKQRMCGNKQLMQSYINVSYIALKGIEYEVNDTDLVLAEIKIRGETFINGSLHIHSRERRWVKPLLIGTALPSFYLRSSSRYSVTTSRSLDVVGKTGNWWATTGGKVSSQSCQDNKFGIWGVDSLAWPFT